VALSLGGTKLTIGRSSNDGDDDANGYANKTNYESRPAEQAIFSITSILLGRSYTLPESVN
jgi:hypothetical protein